MKVGVIFDLDGTLWDATESTACAWNEVFLKYQLEINVTNYDIRSVAGKPYLECLNILCPLAIKHPSFDSLIKDLSVAEKAWMDMLGGDIYPGAIEALRDISQDYPVFMISNCNDWYLRSFLEHSGLANTFEDVTCYGMTGKSKAENIRNISAKARLSNACYVGDTEGDMRASIEAGISYIHASYGFGGEEMEGAALVLRDLINITPLVDYVKTISRVDVLR